mgnify:CR=1 FL=1
MEAYLERFNQTTHELIGDLRAVYPALNGKLDDFLEIYPCNNGNRAYMNYFLENVAPNVDLIVSKNNELFDKTKVLSGIDLKFIQINFPIALNLSKTFCVCGASFSSSVKS